MAAAALGRAPRRGMRAGKRRFVMIDASVTRPGQPGARKRGRARELDETRAWLHRKAAGCLMYKPTPGIGAIGPL